MKLSAILEPLVAAGVDAKTILAAVKAYEDQHDNAIEKRRASDRERQRRHRNVMSRDVTVTERDNRDEVSPKKETSPTPPKEKTTPSVVSEPVGSSTIRPEPEKSAPDPQSPSVIDLPATQGQAVSISESDVAEWRDAFPAVDVLQQLRTMRQWLIANPSKRKTVRGMRKFAVSWLSRLQDKGGQQFGTFQQSQAPPMTAHQQRHQTALDACDRILGAKRDDDTSSNTLDLERGDYRAH